MIYPFAAIVGQEHLKTALLLNAVHPGIGGVLIRGERGTAKSTAARALAALLPSQAKVEGCPFNCEPHAPWAECPHCGTISERNSIECSSPFIDLPLGATEDRVLGTLDFEKALREGRRSFQPGLLASAHRGVLYIDEVNLLANHLVDVLLDAAALGVNTVQREGVAVIHPARFLLVGSMNPEEGDLRPQLLDRFGLMVTVVGERIPRHRAEVVRRRMAFETDPASFAEHWESEQHSLRSRILAARLRLPHVTLDDELLTFIGSLCCEFQVDGMRADIVLHKTARALAAWQDSLTVNLEQIRAAAEFVLPHRQKRRPGEKPETNRERLDELFASARQPQQESGSPLETADSLPEPTTLEETQESQSSAKKQNATESASQVFEPGEDQPERSFEVEARGRALPSPRGRHNSGGTSEQGRYVRAVPDANPSSLALDATLRAAIRRGASPDGALAITRDDWHRKEREGCTGTLVLFAVDASGSMAARRRMEAVKGAALGLLRDAYEQRDRVGVISFRGTQAEVLLQPTRAVALAEQTLRVLPTGGRTPLAHALVLAREIVLKARLQHPEEQILLVLLSDGKANVALPSTEGEPWQQALQEATHLAEAKVPAMVLDTDTGHVRVGRAQALAEALAAEYLTLDDWSADHVTIRIRQRRAALLVSR